MLPIMNKKIPHSKTDKRGTVLDKKNAKRILGFPQRKANVNDQLAFRAHFYRDGFLAAYR